MQNLITKRVKAIGTACIYAAGSGTTVGVAPLGASIPTQFIMTAADIAMCLNVWKIYHDEELSHKKLFSMLIDMGVVTVTSVGAAYIFSNLASAVVSDILWGVSSVLTTTVNGIFALLWIKYCERVYKQRGCLQEV